MVWIHYFISSFLCYFYCILFYFNFFNQSTNFFFFCIFFLCFISTQGLISLWPNQMKPICTWPDKDHCCYFYFVLFLRCHLQRCLYFPPPLFSFSLGLADSVVYGTKGTKLALSSSPAPSLTRRPPARSWFPGHFVQPSAHLLCLKTGLFLI